MNTMSDDPTQDLNELFGNAVRQFMDIFVTPEVTRRQEKGELPRPLELRAAQIIFYADGRRPEVRINSEVKAIGEMKLKDGISKNTGDPVYENELDGLEDIALTQDDDPDCGHATLLQFNGVWFLAFDFIYNKALAKRHIEGAKQFIEAAEYSLTRKHWRAYVDNLFSAAELLAKAVLLAYWSDPRFRRKPSHEIIHSRYNKFAHLGNVDSFHAQVFNRLSRMRYPARYAGSDFALSEDEAGELLAGTKSMLQETMKSTRVQPDQK